MGNKSSGMKQFTNVVEKYQNVLDIPVTELDGTKHD